MVSEGSRSGVSSGSSWYQLALPYAVRVAAHVEDYSVPEALKRIEASMNQSQIDAAKKRLSALKK